MEAAMPVLEGMTSSILASAIFAPVARCFGTGFYKILRLNKLSSIYDGELDKLPAPVQTALDDIVVLLGTWKGEYSEDVKRILDTLKNSTLLTALVEIRLSGENEDILVSEFIDICHSLSVNVPDQKIEELFRMIGDVLENSVRLQVEDKALALLIEANAQFVKDRLEKIESALDYGGGARTLSQEIIDFNKKKILKSLCRNYRSVYVQTIRGPLTVKIDDIFIKSRLMLPPEGESVRQFNLARHQAEDNNFETLNFNEFSGHFRRAIVLGDPGGG